MDPPIILTPRPYDPIILTPCHTVFAGMDPPIFEIENFLSEGECNHLKGLAGETGFFKSDSTYLDGSNDGTVLFN